ncbi:class F sortase [Pseudarthrobacter sp. NBSH8]|uniref:class F sortase n=1 Tax=Pseudarthrobacter sp. NBSH8 TaxID=2596911 RepID=UPI001623967C|nr:class F sortase [Pseudarthrobacter sp. NBSH8]QNE14519.1 class F sortase [Pseudarthrobacter sp. NBSH8]
MKPGRRGGLKATTAAGLLLALALTGCSTGTQRATAPAPPSAAAATAQPSLPVRTPAAPAGPVMPASPPVTLSIPVIDVRTDLLHLGLRENGSLEVPEDTGDGTPASWYGGSPTPGERGPSVILGHVNALGGNKGVFADLQKLKTGDEISVSRTDGSTAVFTVDRGALYSKNSFPTFEVYGNTPGPELRLITCDGYDPATGLFDDNYVIYAKLKA